MFCDDIVYQRHLHVECPHSKASCLDVLRQQQCAQVMVIVMLPVRGGGVTGRGLLDRGGVGWEGPTTRGGGVWWEGLILGGGVWGEGLT